MFDEVSLEPDFPWLQIHDMFCLWGTCILLEVSVICHLIPRSDSVFSEEKRKETSI